MRPVEGQIDDLIGEVNKEIKDHHKVLITDTDEEDGGGSEDYMREIGIRVKYLHSDIDTLERAEIIRDLRLDVFDVLVGINLLREGLGYSGGIACRHFGRGQGGISAQRKRRWCRRSAARRAMRRERLSCTRTA